VGAVAYSTPKDKALTVPAPGVLANASDADKDLLSASPIRRPTNGTLTLDPNGAFVYVPGPGFTGADSFAFNVTDGQGGYALGVASITISERASAQRGAGTEPPSTHGSRPITGGFLAAAWGPWREWWQPVMAA
jgi:large repetitive protein